MGVLFKKIEQNRNSGKIFWKILVFLKDFAFWKIYCKIDCFFSKNFLHLLWYFKAQERNAITPVVLACDRNLDLLEKFVMSYKKNVSGLCRPIVFTDTFGADPKPGFLRLLEELNPEKIIPIKKTGKLVRYHNIQNFAIKDLFRESLPHIKDAMLFLEDDIVFSSKFIFVLRRVPIRKNIGFITLYSPNNGYFYGKNYSLIRRIKPESFFGTQCVLFHKKAVETMAQNFDEMKKFPLGYDIRWAQFLVSQGYPILATSNSYVQHEGAFSSRLYGKFNKYCHKSYKFIK